MCESDPAAPPPVLSRVTVTFVSRQGERKSCTASPGGSVMTIALVHGIDGVLAECGGSLACGTCHVYVDPPHLALIAPPNADEDAMLDTTAAERLKNSRLACQIRLKTALDGLVLHLPERQV